MTLYEMTSNARELLELLEAEEIDEQTVSDTIEAMGVEEKLESYCQVLKSLKADEEMFKEEIDRLTARKRTISNNIDRMKQAMLDFMNATGQDKAKAGTFSVSKSTSQAVEIIDFNLIPIDFRIHQEDKVDKVAIKNAIGQGQLVPGAFITFSEGVRIR